MTMSSLSKIAIVAALVQYCVIGSASFVYGEEDVNNLDSIRFDGVELEGVPSPSPENFRELAEDSSVGTAFAPTTPGGKCLGSDDYLKWKDGGYDNFGPDMQHCAESCTGQLAPANCGFLTQCDPFPYRTCVTKCMGGDASVDRTKLGLIGKFIYR